MAQFMGHRLAFHADGTRGAYRDAEDLVVRDVAPSALAALNSLDDTGVYLVGISSAVPASWLALIFPEPTDLTGIYLSLIDRRRTPAAPVLSPMRIEYSTDTLTGLDGTWTDLGSLASGTTVTTGSKIFYSLPRGTQGEQDIFIQPDREKVVTANLTVADNIDGGPIYSTRTNGAGNVGATYQRIYEPGLGGVHPVNVKRVRGLRFFPPQTVNLLSDIYRFLNIHLYGERSDEVAQRLQIQPTDRDLAMTAEYLDWGNVQVGSSGDKSFRIKNLSFQYTAYDIEISAADTLNLRWPSAAQQFLFSTDGGRVWSQDGRVAALSPGATSAEIRIRRVTDTKQRLGHEAPQIVVEAKEWI